MIKLLLNECQDNTNVTLEQLNIDREKLLKINNDINNVDNNVSNARKIINKIINKDKQNKIMISTVLIQS